MILAQISDFHITRPGTLAYGRVDTHAALAAAVEALNALDPLPDLVIGSGDLTQTGAPEEYAALRAILAALAAPFLPVMGNHDRRGAFAAAFGDLNLNFGPAGFLQAERRVGGLRILTLDTVEEGSDAPRLDTGRLDWLKARLDDPAPTVLVMHHPPFAVGVPWLLPAHPGWSDALGALISAAPQVRRVLCGHVHRAMFGQWRGVSVSTAPATGHQVALSLDPAAPAQLALEAPGFQLHVWDGQGLVTYGASPWGFHDRIGLGGAA